MKTLYFITILLLLTGCGPDQTNEPLPITNNQDDVEVSINTAAQNSEAAVLYEKCQPCHGANAELNALGKSRPIANFTRQEIVNAINGYKDGTRDLYGMGPLMKGQVVDKTDYETKILSDYIAYKL